MPVKLNSSGGGSVTLTTPSTASDFTVTMPAATGTAALTASPTFTGTTTTGAQSVGGNITFSAADAGIIFNKTGAVTNSTLNDYETGTWTPNVGGTATYGTRVAYYTKIGTIVYAFGDITINTIGTGSTSVIAGLPFSANANQGGGVSYFAGLSANVYFIAPQLNVTNVQFITLTTANNTPNNAPAILTSGSRILFTVVYSTTS